MDVPAAAWHNQKQPGIFQNTFSRGLEFLKIFEFVGKGSAGSGRR
jgi:hypothetical protein